MTGLRVPPGQANGARPDEGAAAGPPAPPAGNPSPFGLVGWARWGWRQLTSMRTALVLLFLLAVASVPGSLLPQQGIDPSAVQQYYVSHPALAPWLARLSLFNVFAAPWFAAIYLLLFVSLAGCVVPRSVRLVRSARALPPPAPRNLARLPQSARHDSTLDPAAALEAAAGVLRRRKFRLRTGDGWVSAEKGYRRELGNLVFHLALLALLGAVALGGLFGYKANRLLVSGTSFANTVTALDEFHPGRLVSSSDLQPFTMTLNRFTASYVTDGPSRGQPLSFNAYMSYSAQPGGAVHHDNLRVNHPINVDGVRVFIIGHGYAPVFKVTDGTGKVVFDQPVPFIAVDTSGLTSEGVVKVPDAQPRPARLRRRVPAHRDRRRRPAGVGLPGPARPPGQPGLLPGQPGREQRAVAVGVPAEYGRPDPAAGRAPPARGRSVDQAAGRRRDDHLHRVPAVDQPGHHL